MRFTGNKADAIKQLYADILDVLSAVGIPMDGMSDRRKEKMAEPVWRWGRLRPR